MTDMKDIHDAAKELWREPAVPASPVTAQPGQREAYAGISEFHALANLDSYSTIKVEPGTVGVPRAAPVTGPDVAQLDQVASDLIGFVCTALETNSTVTNVHEGVKSLIRTALEEQRAKLKDEVLEEIKADPAHRMFGLPLAEILRLICEAEATVPNYRGVLDETRQLREATIKLLIEIRKFKNGWMSHAVLEEKLAEFEADVLAGGKAS